MIMKKANAGFIISFDSSNEQMKIERWLIQNMNLENYVLTNFFLLFIEEVDAMAFKLRWL